MTHKVGWQLSRLILHMMIRGRISLFEVHLGEALGHIVQYHARGILLCAIAVRGPGVEELIEESSTVIVLSEALGIEFTLLQLLRAAEWDEEYLMLNVVQLHLGLGSTQKEMNE